MMKNNILQKVVSITMVLTILIGYIPKNLVYATSETIISEEGNSQEQNEINEESEGDNLDNNNKTNEEVYIEEQNEVVEENSKGDEEVETNNDTKDIKANELSSSIIESIEVSSNNVYNGDEVKVSVKISDSQRQNLDHIRLDWENEAGNASNSVYLNCDYDYNENTGKLEDYLHVPSYIGKSTKMELKEVLVVTSDYDEVHINRDNLQSQGINLEKLDINVEPWKPLIKSINISSNEILKGEKMKVEVELDDSSKDDIKTMMIHWENKENEYDEIISILKYNEKSGKFEGETSICFSLDKNVEMIIDNIYIEKNNYVEEYLYRGDLENQGIDLDKLNINILEWKTVIKSVNISNKEMIYPLDGNYKIDISLELEDSDEIKNIQYWYEDENFYTENYLLYNKYTGKYEGSYEFDGVQNGKLQSIRINLKNGSYKIISREKLSSFGVDVGAFDVNLKKIDIPFSIKLSSNKIKAGETLKLSMDLGEYSKHFKEIDLKYMSWTEEIRLKYNENTKLYEGQFVPDKFSDDKQMSLRGITLYGYNGGQTDIYDLKDEFVDNSYFEIINIYDEIIENAISPMKISINKNNFNLGERLVVSAESPGFTMPVSIWLNLINKENKDEEVMYLDYNSLTKKCESTLLIDTKLASGEWVVDSLDLNIEGVDYITIYNSELYNDEKYVKDFKLCNFKINNPVNDTTAPVFNSVSVDKKQGTYGDKIKISVDATDDISGISEINIIYEQGYEFSSNYRNLQLEYNQISKKYEGEITVDAGMTNGDYHISSISIVDNADNTINIEGNESDLSNGNFKVINTVDNAEDIVLSAIASQKTVISGDTVNFEVKLKNNILVNHIVLLFYFGGGSGDGPSNELHLTYDKISKSYKGSWKIYDYYNYNGQYSYINSQIVLNIGEGYNTVNQYIPGNDNLSFDVVNKINNNVKIISNNVDKKRVTKGESINLSIEVEDTTSIKSMKAVYKSPNSELEEIELEKYNNEFSGSLNIDKYSSQGIWKLYKIIVEDLSGNKTIIHTYTEENYYDFKFSEFEVYDTVFDVTRPKLLDIYLDKNYINIGEKIKISIKAEDLESGIKSVEAYLSSDYQNIDNYIEFTYNNSTNCYEYIMDTSQLDIVGLKANEDRICISNVVIEDNAGNIEYNYCNLDIYLYYVKEWFINEINNMSKTVEGYIQKNTKVNVRIDNTVYEGISDSKGYFNIAIPRQNVGTKVIVDVVANNGEILRSFTLYILKSTDILVGWQLEDGKWYYYNSEGEMQKGWISESGVWYYLRNSGEMSTGWVEENGAWYYLNDSGKMSTGWIELNGVWYYLASSGEMATGWISENGIWYYLDGSGAMVTSWLNLHGIWYYLDNNGKMVTGWKLVNRTWYYMYSSGQMATNTIIDGWKIDSSGAATPIK